ncbi:cation efflux family-domain-containing protein [Radiomyces spectabilis]|uniref:cation efflux family-domain-containing protein n=1 Tax=Radiomyces spectabilis TaxID=64574 RepID=UPI002220F820|nr:cation efflux family-domain-containing protein [Radiomyces spectabilis]KAI8394055.1 cation efflux family-domain-containing protein [Radiomyces spectabilis]
MLRQLAFNHPRTSKLVLIGLAQRKPLARTTVYRTGIQLRHHASHHNHNHKPGHSHGHSHGDGHVHADLMTTIKQSSKKGIQITVIGLVANVGLTVSKGVAGWLLNSASLLADAAHSFSDLLSDFVTLYTFKMSRKPPDAIYPYGYGKFETLGSLAVSSLLIGGAVSIGLHSSDLLMAALDTTHTTTPQMVADTVAASSAAATESASHSSFSSLLHHSHHHDGLLDPNAAWFALASVIVKEWLYRATIKVGRSEKSDVLIANAWHHRSDAYSSGVALVAIGGSYAGMTVLDPLGGLLVAGMIFRSGAQIMSSSVKELMDKGLSEPELDEIRTVIRKVQEKETDLVDFHSVRGRKLGPFQHLDLILQLNPQLPVAKAHSIEQQVRSAIKTECSNVQEVLIHLDAEKQPPHH